MELAVKRSWEKPYHSTFQFNAFSPIEERYIQNSLYFKNFFEHNLNEVEKSKDYYVINPQLMQRLLI